MIRPGGARPLAAVVILALVCLGLGWVIGRRGAADPPPAPPSYLQELTRTLDLRPDQVAALDRLLSDEDRDLAALVAEQRELLRGPVAERRQQTERALLALLDDGQRDRYERLTQH